MIFRLDPPWIALLLPLPLLALTIWWSYYISFPILMEKQVRKGKSWLYFPMQWSRRREFYGKLNTLLLAATGIAIGFSIWWSFASDWRVLFFLMVLSCAATSLLSRQISAIRYLQQAALYYSLLNSRCAAIDEQETRISEGEIRSLVSWEHQQQLLEADRKGKLLELLAGESGVKESNEEKEDE